MALHRGNGNVLGNAQTIFGKAKETVLAGSDDPVPCTQMIAGGLLALYGLSRRSLTGLALAGIGGTMLYRAYQSHCCNLMPSYRAAPERPHPLVAANRVDEASWESFPASDAPAVY